MANMVDYLEWRGDLSFRTAGFNEVDNLLLAQLAYVEFDGIVPGEDSTLDITLGEASEQFWSCHEEEDILARVSMTKWAPVPDAEDGGDEAVLRGQTIEICQRYQ